MAESNCEAGPEEATFSTHLLVLTTTASVMNNSAEWDEVSLSFGVTTDRRKVGRRRLLVALLQPGTTQALQGGPLPGLAIESLWYGGWSQNARQYAKKSYIQVVALAGQIQRGTSRTCFK
jgi:hypothetical protein